MIDWQSPLIRIYVEGMTNPTVLMPLVKTHRDSPVFNLGSEALKSLASDGFRRTMTYDKKDW